MMVGLALGQGGPEDVETFAQALSAAANVHVEARDVRWEPSSGLLGDLALGRFVLFLGSDVPAGARDVYRARVRLSPEGRILSVASVRNLTATPLGDDHALVVSGGRAAFATYAFGQEQSVSALDLTGDEGSDDATTLQRGMALVTNLQRTGASTGVGRFDVTLDPPARAVGLSLAESGALQIDVVDDGGRHGLVADLAKGEVISGKAHGEVVRTPPKLFAHWAVDTARAVPWIGPAPIAWLEDKAFAARDAVKQLRFHLQVGDAEAALAQPGAAAGENAEKPKAPRAPFLENGLESGGEGDGTWPPADLTSIWKSPPAGEGHWDLVRLPWLHRLAVAADKTGDKASDKVPPPFARTFVRPDETRPYAEVLLVAMDMRQLDLAMEAGSEDPKPLTGAPGTGRIPRDPAIAGRVVAAFNGAFKTEHGRYGMMVNRRVLLPAQPGAASVAVLKDGRVAMGSWPASPDLTGVDDVPAGAVVSFRQNLDPLVDQGKVNPSGRGLWGFTLPGTSAQTERSGLCVTGAGHLIYAWGDDVSATTLAKAMKAAGCTYGMHLDMNPHHTGFLFTAIEDARARKYRSELLSDQMEINRERYVEYSAKDFFYVMLREPAPPAITGTAAASASPWTVAPGAQPAPAWSPALWTARVDGVEVLEVEPGRAGYRIRAGANEPDPGTGVVPLRALAEGDAKRVLFAVGLGTSTENRMRGLATEGRQILPVHGEGSTSASAMLVAGVSEEGKAPLAIVLPTDPGSLSARADVAEVPLLVKDGAVVVTEPSSKEHVRPAPRMALGIDDLGRVLLARGTFSSYAPLAVSLQRLGAQRGVALDRGLRGAAFLDRTGTATPPRAAYDETVLYAVAAAPRPRAFRFEARP